MTHHIDLNSGKISWGSTAVDGVLAGFVGGIVMLLLWVGYGGWQGLLPAELLAFFDPNGGQSALNGLASHLAVSSIYGLVFALLSERLFLWWHPLRPYYWVIGGIFGLALAGIVRGWFLSASHPLRLVIPAGIFFTIYLVYGVVIGVQIGRQPAVS